MLVALQLKQRPYAERNTKFQVTGRICQRKEDDFVILELSLSAGSGMLLTDLSGYFFPVNKNY